MIHTIENEFLRVCVSEQGAELQSILGSDGTEYLWQADPAYWGKKAPNIFPYVARLVQGSYYLDGQLYQMKIHGIAQYRSFSLKERSAQRLVLELCSDADTYAQYPRRFAFRVIYALEDNTLHVTYEAENLDSQPMYFGLGGHPGFRVPLVNGLDFTDYRLRFSSPCVPERVGFNADCFVTGQNTPYPLEGDTVLKLQHELFDDDAIVLHNMAHTVTLETEKDCHGVTVTYPDMPYLGIWHMPKTDAPYVCIEPWSSLPAKEGSITVLEEQQDLICLSGGKTYTNTWQIAIH